MDLTILLSLARESILVDKEVILLSMVVSWDCASLSQVLRQAVMRMSPASWASILGSMLVLVVEVAVLSVFVLTGEVDVP